MPVLEILDREVDVAIGPKPAAGDVAGQGSAKCQQTKYRNQCNATNQLRLTVMSSVNSPEGCGYQYNAAVISHYQRVCDFAVGAGQAAQQEGENNCCSGHCFRLTCQSLAHAVPVLPV